MDIVAPVNAASLPELMKYRRGAHRVSIFDVAGDAVPLMREIRTYNRAASNDDTLSEDDTAEQAGTWFHMIDRVEAHARELHQTRERPLAA